MTRINNPVKPTEIIKEITNLTLQRHSRMMAEQILKPLPKPFQDILDAAKAKREAEWAALPWHIKLYRKASGLFHG